MALASYEIAIPNSPGRPVAPYALDYLSQAIRVTMAHIEPRNIFMNGQTQPCQVLVFTAEATPHTDSSAKQIAAYCGEVVNVPSILVSKTDKSGIQSWPVRNSQFQA